MNENRFTPAAIVSIAAALIYPAAIVVDAIQMSAMEQDWWSDGPSYVGSANFVWMIFLALAVYAYKSLKSLLYEHYSYRKVGLVILASIVWHILFFGGSFILELVFARQLATEEPAITTAMISFWIVGTAVFGIIDIIMGIILIRDRQLFQPAVKTFAILTLIVGICEATIILIPLCLLLVPIQLLALAYLFAKKVKEVEFV